MDDGALEILTYEQFMQEMKYPGSVQGTSVGTVPIMPKREPMPGTELLKQRVNVSFDFDVICNDEPIRNSNDEEEVKQYDLALLRSFLTSDKKKLLHMMLDAIATQIGLNSPETFITTFLGQIDTNSHVIFGSAIDALRGDAGDYWREARDDSDLPWGDVLTLATGKLFECFEAKFVCCICHIVGEEDNDN